MKDVSIIIVGLNVRDVLQECLTSIHKETKGIDFEIIYIDNASNDESVEMVRKNFPETVIIQNEQNNGFVKSNNQGIEISKGRYILLLNSDTVILDNAIAKTINFADSHPEAAVVGCKVLNPDKTPQSTMCCKFPSVLNLILSGMFLDRLFPKNKFFGREGMEWWGKNSISEVDVVSGCYMLVRKEAIDKIGGMDERYFIYSEEVDWCYRFKKSGWKILFTPEPEIIHYGGQTTKQTVEKFKLQYYGSKLIFMRLHKSTLEFLFTRFLIALFLFLRIPLWIVVAIFKRNKRKRAITIIKIYCKCGFYCLLYWKNLLINKEAIKGQL